ncbi:hypothetical protein KW789_00540 [Candidatus Saccharibacteria bacterium]|nr:hypothetical protein [Candidatus Saccharibacteria bacterium]
MKQLMLNLQRLGDWFDSQLDRLTTYRLVLYLLYAYVGAAVLLSLTGTLSFSALDILLSLAVLMTASRAANWLISSFLRVPRNHESDLISSLILSLILTPASDVHGFLILAGAAAVAMVSKYILTIQKRHIFNPAALGAYASGLLFNSHASWWIGTQKLTPFVVIGGFLILRKMKRFQMVGVFLYVFLFYIIWTASSGNIVHHAWLALGSTPVLFFATIMLTEPLTSPSALRKSLMYALLVGVLYSVVKLRFSPEEALLAGNALTYLMTPNRSIIFNLLGHKREAESIFSFIFEAPKKLSFQAGQYLEWTLPGVAADSRGNRRYLTIASSPTEKDIMFTVKMPGKASSFKSSLMSLKPGGQILASQLAGSFVLPKKLDTKMAFIAGGVGITPFRSMVKYLLDNGRKVDLHLLYSVNSADELAFSELWNDAKKIGVKTGFVVSAAAPENWKGLSGYVDDRLIAENVSDYKQRLFYISGPQAFVAAVHQALLRLGVERSNIKTDFFPGYN